MEDTCTPEPVFAEMAKAAGLKSKGMYTLREVERASSVPFTTLSEDAKSGRIKTFMPPGRKRGRLVKPEWFDEWFREGLNA